MSLSPLRCLGFSFPLVLGSKTKHQIEQNPIKHSPTQHHQHPVPFLPLICRYMQPFQDIETRDLRFAGEGIGCLVLVHQETFVRVSHGGHLVHPHPILRHLVTVYKVPAEEEEQSRECNHRRVPQNVVRHHRAHEHHEGVCGEEGDVEHKQKVVEPPSKLQSVPNNGCIDCGLERKEGKVGDEACYGVGRRAIRVVRGLPDEDEAFLDEGGDCVVGGEEEEADGEDEEAKTVRDALSVCFRVHEHGCHHDAHHGQDHEPGQEELGGSLYVLEVATHQDPGFGEERVVELWTELEARLRGGGSEPWGQVVVLVDRVVAAVRSRGVREDFDRVGVVVASGRAEIINNS